MQALLNPTKLILGVGEKRHEGYFGIDITPTSATDMVFDLDKPNWPIQDDSIEEVQAVHFLEHIHNHIQLFNEVYRIMKPNGKFMVMGPHAQSDGAWQDPTHTRPLSLEFFRYFNREWQEAIGIHYGGYQCDFVITKIGYTPHPDYKNVSTEVFLEDIKHKFNVANELSLELTAVK